MREYLEADEKTFGRVLKVYRKTNKMTQKRVAEYLGIDRSTYAKYETIRKPEIDVILKLSVLYNISLDEFMGSFFIESQPPREITPVAVFSAPEQKDLIEVSLLEKRLLMLYRNSIRKAEIMKTAEKIFNADNELIKEIESN